jgi:hypothetical protein
MQIIHLQNTEMNLHALATGILDYDLLTRDITV